MTRSLLDKLSSMGEDKRSGGLGGWAWDAIYQVTENYSLTATCRKTDPQAAVACSESIQHRLDGIFLVRAQTQPWRFNDGAVEAPSRAAQSAA